MYLKDKYLEEFATISKLQWDTDYFGINCAKVILHKALEEQLYIQLLKECVEYQFITIENRNSDPTNSFLIGKNSCAFLADTNIQFSKNIYKDKEKLGSINIFNSMKPNEAIFDLLDFPYSRFIVDQELNARGGSKIYHNWVSNAFNKLDKFFAISTDTDQKANGFILYSFTNSTCIIELIAVSATNKSKGIGTQLFNAVENEASLHGCKEIRVGTQGRNITAINFYNKVGCRQIGCHQIYHLWNIH